MTETKTADGTFSSAFSSFYFLLAGIGGNTWAVTRQSGQSDELSLRDDRLTVGLRSLVSGGGGCFAELGIAMGRRLEHEQQQIEIPLDDAILMQAGWRY